VGYTDKNDDYYRETGINVPDCHISGTQKFFEKYVTGKVLFRGFKRGLFQKFLKDLALNVIWKPTPIMFYEFIKKTKDGEFADELGMNQDYSDVKEDYKGE